MKTGEVSEKFNINIEELRYYESVGLLDDVKINDGIREYEDKDIKILSKVIITKAAEILNITQPTLSRQLIQLEEELDTKLFIRGKHKITLTEPVDISKYDFIRLKEKDVWGILM